MIQSKGQYACTFELGNLKNFIEERNFNQLILSSDAGGNLPSFKLSFSTNRSSIFSFLNEGNLLKIGLGTDIKNIKNNIYKIYGQPEIKKIGTDVYMISLSGLLNAPNYFGNFSHITEKVSAVEAAQEMMKRRGFLLDKNNVAKSKDEQRWIQFGCSDRRFLNYLLIHADTGLSAPLFSITKENVFRLYDLDTVLKQNKYKYRFTQFSQKNNDIVFEDAEYLNDRTSIINSWIGYDTEEPEFNLISGQHEKYLSELKNILSINKYLGRAKNEEKRLEEISFMNDNVHSNFNKSRLRNLRKLIALSNLRLGISFDKIFRPIEPLDIVIYEDPETGNKGFNNKFVSGMYIVTKNVLTFENRNIRSYNEIARESFNYMKGEIV